ncbi:hypothetical protein [Nocardia sp.]|uniref:hypothetical protein n=1 Tax=Nocardia sp. TaxID=1821 RepID=UPI00260E30C8|nr:hypothetical protein [Nocardia sp.]
MRITLVGQRQTEPEDMIYRMRGVLGKVYDIYADPSEYLPVGTDRVVRDSRE